MVEELFRKFKQSTVLVIGDVMIDAYLTGSVSRISPEAPVPIVDIQNRFYRLGGAANVAVNLHSLGAKPILCSVVGNDDKGLLFSELLKEKDLSDRFILHSNHRKTTIKYRIVGNKLQMLRIDEENLNPLLQEENDKLIESIKKLIDNQSIDAIIFEDYDKGVLSENIIHSIIDLANAKQIPVTVDPKKNNFNFYRGCTFFKPNLKELKEGLRYESSEFSQDAVNRLMKSFALDNDIHYLFTTLSERGVVLYDSHHDSFYLEPAYLRKISDVSGAGDTVISVATLCLLAGLSPEKTAQIANLAGGIVCEFSGVVPIPLEDLKREIIKNALLSN